MDDKLIVDQVQFTTSDVIEMTRLCLTETPLQARDERLKLMDEIKTALIKKNTQTGIRWVVLDALRNVSMRKWRARRHQQQLVDKA